MTIQGAIQKSVVLTVISAAVGIALFIYSFMTLNVSLAYAQCDGGGDWWIHSLALITTF